MHLAAARLYYQTKRPNEALQAARQARQTARGQERAWAKALAAASLQMAGKAAEAGSDSAAAASRLPDQAKLPVLR